jgi:hypothetical protein
MSHLIQILLPLRDSAGQPFAPSLYSRIAGELTQRFGGLTAFERSPGEGLWRDEGARTRHDEVVVYEVMVEELDEAWWGRYRGQLEELFRQDEIAMRATAIVRF